MKKNVEFEVLNPHCAGIDVGSKSHYVSVGQEDSEVREFGVCTKDFESMSNFLREHQITHIAMESTGSYFQSLFLFLQLQGFEVILIHGGVIKNISGKKTDVIDCKWIQKLYSLGFLKSCFLPSNSLNDVRTLYRHRLNLLEESSKLINRMNKSLRLMNIRLDNAINDLAGKTGQAILSAIINGEKDPQKLAQLADSRIRIVKMNWKNI